MLSHTLWITLVSMEIEPYSAQRTPGPPHIPRQSVNRALSDARSVNPVRVSRPVALSVARGSAATARLRLERLARVVMAADPSVVDPTVVWSADWTQMDVAGFEALDRGIGAAWSSPATRNAMRDAVRAVVREELAAGLITADEATPRLNAVRIERRPRDESRQARGHVPADRVRAVFADLAADESLTARRDAALVALLVGAGLRRAEACGLTLADLDDLGETLTVTGKGRVVRDVPLAPGVRRAVAAWLRVRGPVPGHLLTPVSPSRPRHPETGRAMSANTVARVVARRFGPGVAPHDLRRTFAGNLLDSGADLSVVSRIMGHQNPATTAGYDRRGFAARQQAVDRLDVPFVAAGGPV